MTTSEFLRRRNFGQIEPTQRVRSIIWCFPGGHEWTEVFIDENYGGTIERQEDAFRAAMTPLAQFITHPVAAGEKTPTVAAKDWRGL